MKSLQQTLCGFIMLLQLGAASLAAQSADANPAVIPTARTEGWWLARHQAKVEEAKRGKVDLLFVGDSITQNYERTGPAPQQVFLPTWNEFFAPHHAMNLGFSGDQTQHVLWRLQHGEVDGLKPKNIVLLIGTNNTTKPEQTAGGVAAGVIAVVEELHRRMPAAKITVIDILPHGMSAKLSETDAAVNATVTQKYAASSYVTMLDLSSLFFKDGVLDRSLFYDPTLDPPKPPHHPNTEGQRRMAAAVAKSLYGQ